MMGKSEKDAINKVLEYGARYGYGNLIAHLKWKWAHYLIDRHNMTWDGAKLAADTDAMPEEYELPN
jgi:hypothetical protein